MRRSAAGRVAVLAALAVLVIGCDTGTPPPSTATEAVDPDHVAAAQERSEAFRAGIAVRTRADARRAAKAYVQAHCPGERVQGISTLYLEDAQFLVTVDFDGDARPGLTLIARAFFTDGGTSYWRADRLDAAQAEIVGAIWQRKSERRKGHDEADGAAVELP